MKEKPDFSGDWRMDPQRSDFEPLPIPARFDRAIEHRNESLRIATKLVGPGGQLTTELDFTTDGKETSNQVRGTLVRCAAEWDGDHLRVYTTRTADDLHLSIDEKWTLSADCTTLTIAAKVQCEMGSANLEVVFTKEENPALPTRGNGNVFRTDIGL